MRVITYLIVPTIMVGFGLYLFSSATITFLLFYSWLFGISYLHRKNRNHSVPRLKRSLIIGLFSGMISFLSIFIIVMDFQTSLLDVDQLQVLLEKWQFSGVGLVIVLIFINPVLEEVYWRRVIHDQLRKKMNYLSTLSLTAGFYSLYHLLTVIPLFDWPFDLFSMLPVFFAGLFWGHLREKTGSLAGPIISHLLADAAIMSIYWILFY